MTATLLWLPDPMNPASATQSVNIPADPALNGILISFQSVALTPGINALSASTSNAVAATLNQ